MNYQLNDKIKEILKENINNNILPKQEIDIINKYIENEKGYPISTINIINSAITYLRKIGKCNFYLNQSIKSIVIPSIIENQPV